MHHSRKQPPVTNPPPQVDVYSFAMICYHLFEGVPPFFTLGPVDAARAAALEGTRPHWGEYNAHSKGTRCTCGGCEAWGMHRAASGRSQGMRR